jgi:hypothetical protein
MARNTGDDHRDGAVDDRTQGKNPHTGNYTKRNRDEGSPDDGKYMDVKQDGEKFKGVAKEPDRRRKND